MKTILHLCAIWSIGFLIGSLISLFKPVSPFLFAAILTSWPLIGFVVTVDDDLPGGWSNPDGDQPFPRKELMIVSCAVVVAWTMFGFGDAFVISDLF